MVSPQSHVFNILRMKNVKKKNRVIYDSENKEIFIVINIRPGGHIMIFTDNTYELYYNDMRNTKGVSMFSNVK